MTAALDPIGMGTNLDVSRELVVVPDLIVDLPTETNIDMGTDPNMKVDPILVINVVLDVPIRTKIKMVAELGVVTVEPIQIADMVFRSYN